MPPREALAGCFNSVAGRFNRKSVEEPRWSAKAKRTGNAAVASKVKGIDTATIAIVPHQSIHFDVKALDLPWFTRPIIPYRPSSLFIFRPSPLYENFRGEVVPASVVVSDIAEHFSLPRPSHGGLKPAWAEGRPTCRPR